MELSNSLRQQVKKVMQHYATGIWLDDLPVAWSNVHGRPAVQLQTAMSQAGFPDHLTLVKSCAFCQITVQPEYAHRPIVRYSDPGPKVDQMARQLRADMCQRHEHVTSSDIFSQICRRFGVPTFDCFDMPVASVPSLHQLVEVEAKVYNFTSAYVAAREIMTLYDLEQQLCLELSVDEFSQLSLGPLLRNPVVVKYFQPPQALEQIPKVMLSDVIKAVKHLLTPKNPQVQPHAVMQLLTREFDVDMPQDLCVKVESTEGIVKLVAGIQQEEDRITKAAKDKILLEVHQNISRLEVAKDSDVNLEALRLMNAARVPNQASISKAELVALARNVWAEAPTPVMPLSFLQDSPPANNTPQAAWMALQKKNDTTRENVLTACKHKPVVFSLSLLAKAFCDSRKRQEGVAHSRKLHSAWVEFWNRDVLAGLVLRAQAELMYEPAFLSKLPEPLTATLTDSANALCAAMLHLNRREVTWGALYAYFLAHVRSYLQSYRDYKVDVQELGKHLAKFFQTTLSREAGTPRLTQQLANAQFWSTDALALYLLHSLVKLLGCEPQYPDSADVQEAIPEISASNVLRSPSTAPRQAAAAAAAATTVNHPIVLDDAESDPPHDSHWLLRNAPSALTSLSAQLALLKAQEGAAAISAVERAANRIRDKDNDTWQFLRKFAGLPEDINSWDAATPAKAANGIGNGACKDDDIQVASKQSKPAGQAFKPISAQHLHSAAAQLYIGSSPAQLANLEIALQGHFNAPSFGALGHGPSLLQCCCEDEVIMQTVSSQASTVPLNKVLMVTQQAAQALITHSMASDKQTDVANAVAACLCEHFRLSSVEALGHGNIAHLMATAQAQAESAPQAVLSAAALAASRSSAYSKGTVASRGRASAADDACKCLLKAPMLSELHEWTSWNLLFEQELGSLFDFLQDQGVVSAVELSAGKLIRISQNTSSEDYSASLSQRDATGVVAVLLGIVAVHRGVQHAPLAMLAARTKMHLAAMDSAEAMPMAADGSKASRGLPRAAAFVLECLEKLPELFRCTLGQPMLLHPFNEVAESTAYAEQSLLKAAISPSHRTVLHRLGFQLGITLWQDAWRSSMLPPSPQPPPAPTALASTPPDISLSQAQLGSVHTVLDQLLGGAQAQTQRQFGVPNGDLESISHDTVSPMQTDATAASTADTVASQPPSVSPAGDESQRCMAIIEAIRQEEFGMNVELDAASSQLRQRQNERIGRALQRLSQELYSKDTHFVLELVQNADDNSYPSGVLPALEFILQDTGVTVLNNEVGFSESNIRALCDVGRTTKKHTVGYIGQKGIGFKSVFKITDAPQIHSGGFHVAFDLMQHSALGYVLPTWVPDAKDISAVSKLGRHQTATKVVLPFKQAQSTLDSMQGSQQQASTLRHRFDDVRPTLLLFLQRLQCIVVNDATTGETSIMVRRPLGGGLMELRHGPNAEHSSRWLQVSHTFQPSVPRLEVQLQQTTVSLAFNLEGEAPTQQQVYAFLPLRSYGLSFIVQADFIVPSSREAVDCDSAWNELLREQVPNLFLQALQSFKQLSAPVDDQPMAWAQSFFAALPHSLAARLQQSQCIPTESNHWVYPSEALVCQDPQVRALLADTRLPASVTLQYAHSGLSVLHSSQPLRALLGVGELAHGHLLDVVRQLQSSSMLTRMGLPWLAQLLLCVFDSLQQERPGGGAYQAQCNVAVVSAAAKAATAELRKLLLLPLSDGTFAAVEDEQQQSLYFPLDMDDSQGTDEEESGSAVTSKQRELLKRCKLNLRVLNPTFLEAAGQDKKSALVRALETLGLKHIMLPDIICNHVLPALPASGQVSQASHIAYLALIISSGLTAPEALNPSLATKIISKLKGHGQVATNHGMKQLQEDFLHLPVHLGNKVDLAQLFPQHDWLFPSEGYLASGAGSSTAWRTLFKALGFTDFLQAPIIALKLAPEQKAATHWADADLGTPDASGSYTLQDRSAAEFKAVLQSLHQQCKDRETLELHCGRLAHHIDASWENEYAGCTSVQLHQQANGQLAQVNQPSSSLQPHSTTPPTSFLHALQTSAWLPSSLGGVQTPSALFYPSPQTLSLLGDNVPYLACPVKEPSLLTALGVVTEITWQDVLRMLSTWSTLASFKSSVEQMSNVYTFLAAAMEREQGAAAAICAAFAQSALVWLPSKEVLADVSNTAAGTPFQREASLVPYEATPQSTYNRRKRRKKVNFMTPGTQARGVPIGTPAAPAYTPYTLTPGWTAPNASRHTQGQFYAATGDLLRLWDPTGVIEGVSPSRLGIRIMSEVYSNQAVMSFFAEGLVHSSSPHSSPIRQFAGLEGNHVISEPKSVLQRVSTSHQQQQQQQQAKSFPAATSDSQAGTAVKAKPARPAPSLGPEDYIDLISSDEDLPDALPEQGQDSMAAAAATHQNSLDADAVKQQPHDAAAGSDQDQTHPATDAAQLQPSASSDPAQRNADEESSMPPPSPASPAAQAPPPSDPQSMILAEPTCQDYCQALAAVAEPAPPAMYTMQLNKVLAILSRWSQMIADKTMEEKDIVELRKVLLDVKAFPIAGQQWASLSHGLILNDEPALAHLFEGAKGVALLHLPVTSSRSSSTPAYGEVEPLLKALHVLPLSRAVQHSVLPVAGWSGSVELDPIVAECLLALQRFLIHHMPALYHAVQDTVTPLLLNLRCVIVGSLQVAYRLPTASGITISQPQPRAAALQDSDLYVEVDKLDSYTQILPELTRMFAHGAIEPDLAQFLIALTLTMLSRQDVEAFMQQKGCPPLPDHIPEWQTPHLAKPPPEEVEDGELDEEAAEAKMQEERLAVGEGLVGDLAMVRTKRDHPSADSDDSEEPSSKKQKVGYQPSTSQAGHYTPMMDPSSRRVDYLDLATPQSASRSFQSMHQPPRRPSSPSMDPHRPFLSYSRDDMGPMPPAHAPLHMHPSHNPPGAPRPSHVGHQIGIPSRRAPRRPGVREHDIEVYQQLASEAGIPPEQMVSSIQDLFDAMYPYKATPWVLQDIGHQAPAIWRAIAALAVRAPQHLPSAIRNKPRPMLDGPALRIDPAQLNQQTGRWGEELVFSYLQWQLAAFTPGGLGMFCDQMFVCPSTGWQVEWINYKAETRKPFDVRIRDPNGDDIFIEVKASALRGKNIFNMSLPEMKFAEAQGNNLHIYRVAGVGADGPTLTRLVNPIQLSKMKLINLCVQM